MPMSMADLLAKDALLRGKNPKRLPYPRRTVDVWAEAYIAPRGKKLKKTRRKDPLAALGVQ